ncbi:prolyl oligopeptidase family serine peptidase [Microlunatus elymi]|uniref:Prolyl oligopeptidase family serine peptidase n=1 Tax=Microlunatus elymi TaxID=2596828 RepID=A0A516Q4H0_9ACTN|nr:PHB depolymerase family esterase [Microlunatus elymi]QDP98308.1 prolyl oligopeptidase family serine peptidase [Microlunatus elymi]
MALSTSTMPAGNPVVGSAPGAARRASTRVARTLLRAVLSLALGVILLGSVAGCGSDDPEPLQAGVNDLSIQHRKVVVHVPTHPDGPLPLVLVVHHYTGSIDDAMLYGFENLVDSKRFVAVYPEGVDGSFNAGHCCGDAADKGTDDVALLTSVVKSVEQRVDIDPDRVFVTGFSNGGMMSYRLACQTDLFAAIAPVSGDIESTCDHPSRVSVLHVHGLADPMVTFQPASDAPWRKVDNCAQPKKSTQKTVHRSVARCADGRAVEVITVDGAGHQVPETYAQFNVANTIWAFFEAHPLVAK